MTASICMQLYKCIVHGAGVVGCYCLLGSHFPIAYINGMHVINIAILRNPGDIYTAPRKMLYVACYILATSVKDHGI